MDYIIIVYIVFGVLPSLAWLAYYMRKDLHPEPKRMVLKVFLLGAVITLPVFFVQIGMAYLLGMVNFGSIATTLIYWFLIIAFSEEFFIYLVIRLWVLNSPDLDEPLDIMLYMIIASLGFAALENVLYLFTPTGQMTFNQLVDRTLVVSVIRFVGATFLHTLCSAVIGYSLAISLCEVKRKYLIFAFGIFLAVILHGFYDFSIMTLNGYAKIIIPAVVILTLAFLVYVGFEKLKKMKGICKIKTL